MIRKIKEFLKLNNLDGYLIPKNDIYFTEYSKVNNLEKVTNFTGSAGFALILKKKNYLYVDGRYTLQAKQQAGKNFVICNIPKEWPKDLQLTKSHKIGFDPKLSTEDLLCKYFANKVNLVPIYFDFKNKIDKKFKKFFQLDKKITGETSDSKIKRLKTILNKTKINYLYISSSENVCWLLNIRGADLPNSPLANCKLIFTNHGKLHLLVNKKKIVDIKKNFKNITFYGETNLLYVLNKLKIGNFNIDKSTCSIFDQNIIKSKFIIKSKIDPIYNLKTIKNNIEIKNTLDTHLLDGIALTKFLYWFKFKNHNFTEKKIIDKLEKLRKRSKKYLYPSFDTIAGSGPNGSIIHYRSTSKTNRNINKNDILLVDSGGQYKWGTTDVTRTTCSGNVSMNIKNNFTRVLKGHISVINCDLKKNFNGHLIDKIARRPLKKVGLDYSHGTGHGVGFFLNVHEGPISISKFNFVTLKKGMILSNEPGYYLNNKYGIRIENLIYVDEFNKNLKFKNLTFAPIDLDMVNFRMLNKKEKEYLFDYHLIVYSKLSKYLNKNEKKWLINLIK